MAEAVDIKYYGIHTWCRAAAEAIEAAQTNKLQIHAETCVQYTTLDRTAYEEQGLLPMIAPPLRTPDDGEAMFEHLRGGTLDVVSTDHVAAKEVTKQIEHWWESKYGSNRSNSPCQSSTTTQWSAVICRISN